MLLIGAAASLSIIGVAEAQDAPSAGGAPSTSSSPATELKTGMTVKDSAGATVGKIAQVGQTADGTPAVTIAISGGKKVAVPASALTVNGHQAVSSMTKAEIEGAGAAKPGG
jgi:hypothetical protein